MLGTMGLTCRFMRSGGQMRDDLFWHECGRQCFDTEPDRGRKGINDVYLFGQSFSFSQKYSTDHGGTAVEILG
jgi:hypothetical protein